MGAEQRGHGPPNISDGRATMHLAHKKFLYAVFFIIITGFMKMEA
jgi:hypothetical protein